LLIKLICLLLYYFSLYSIDSFNLPFIGTMAPLLSLVAPSSMDNDSIENMTDIEVELEACREHSKAVIQVMLPTYTETPSFITFSATRPVMPFASFVNGRCHTLRPVTPGFWRGTSSGAFKLYHEALKPGAKNAQAGWSSPHPTWTG
jgi:hypothetical protein